MKIHEIDCVFMPMALFTNKRLMPLVPKIKGATPGWYVNRKFVSYKQIKKAIIANSPATSANQPPS